MLEGIVHEYKTVNQELRVEERRNSFTSHKLFYGIIKEDSHPGCSPLDMHRYTTMVVCVK